LVRAAEAGIQEMESNFDLTKTPMIIATKGFCRFFLRDPVGALAYLEHYVSCTSHKPNAAQLGFIYSGIGVSNYFLGRFDCSLSAYLKAIELARKVGDDARISLIAGNLCTLLMHCGEYDESIRYGQISIRFGEASSSSTLLVSYINLMDPYLLTGQQDKAVECLEKAREWLGPERRWKLRCTFLLETASFALIQRNLSLALDLIDQLETIARGREDALPMPGPYWKLVAFRRAHLGRSDEAYSLARSLAAQWKETYVIHYLEMVATMAWLEYRENGQITRKTAEELEIFDAIGSRGKRALLALQGFLPSSVGTRVAQSTETSGGYLKTRSAV
jgi:tetratricopeptide (TPR) repeat protein